ncbi:PAS and ANTAR domain-containing protein [Luteimicrobium sp. NPDC057192]|uniref:PAS and ANTAR domain-containing protein n=1 Tax=Luteimicrobium sp. NPDC057192 TaxID=3346042 RepID=UPI003633D06C
MSLPSTENPPVTPHDDARPTGDFRYDITGDRWWWSEGTYRIHGFQPGDVLPTTALVLAHKHPDDQHRFYRIFAEACQTGSPFVSVHRIMDATGRTRHIVLTGQGSAFDGARATELSGRFTEITDDVARVAMDTADEQIRAASDSRGVIEQAKGALAVVLGITPEAAFQRLREQSMADNVSVRRLAEQLVAQAPLLHAGRADALEQN